MRPVIGELIEKPADVPPKQAKTDSRESDTKK
jgi:hypothetical protein